MPSNREFHIFFRLQASSLLLLSFLYCLNFSCEVFTLFHIFWQIIFFILTAFKYDTLTSKDESKDSQFETCSVDCIFLILLNLSHKNSTIYEEVKTKWILRKSYATHIWIMFLLKFYVKKRKEKSQNITNIKNTSSEIFCQKEN